MELIQFGIIPLRIISFPTVKAVIDNATAQFIKTVS